MIILFLTFQVKMITNQDNKDIKNIHINSTLKLHSKIEISNVKILRQSRLLQY